MTFMDILRKDEDETTAVSLGGDIHADIYEIFDKYQFKNKEITEKGLEKADYILEQLIDFGTLREKLKLTNIFREPFLSNRKLEGAAISEQFALDMDKFSRKTQHIYDELVNAAEQSVKLRKMTLFKTAMDVLFGKEVETEQINVRTKGGERPTFRIIDNDLPPKKDRAILYELMNTLSQPATKTSGLLSDLKKLLTVVSKEGAGDITAQKHIKSLRNMGFFNRKNTSKIQDFLYNGKSLPSNFKKLFIEPASTWDEEENDWSSYRMFGNQTSKELMLEILEREGVGRTDVSARKPIRDKLKRYFSMDLDATTEKMEKIMFDGKEEDFHFLFDEDYSDDILFGIYRITAKLNKFYNNLKREYSMESYEHRFYGQKRGTGKKQETSEANRLLRVLEFLLTANKLTGNSDKLKMKNLEVVTKLRKVGTRSFQRKKDKTVGREFDTFNVNTIDVTESTSKFPKLIAAWDSYSPKDKSARQITIEGKKFEEGTPKEDMIESFIDDIEKLKSRLKRSKAKKTIEAREKEIAAIQSILTRLRPRVSELKETKKKNTTQLISYIRRLVDTQMPNVEQTIKNNEEMLERLKRNQPDEYKYKKRETEDKIYALKHQLKLTNRLVNELAHEI